jgi:NitT/TauT family transport system permease protein
MTDLTPSTPAITRARWVPNLWDVAALVLVLGVIALLGVAARGMTAPISSVEGGQITLDPLALPYYALRSTLRMLLALLASILFTLGYGALAAKSRRAGLLMVPILDVLQSVPILGFLSITVTFFLAMAPGSVLGAELASIFAIFTSQAWNMTFSFYQSLRTVPGDLDEACRAFGLSRWQRFWRLDVPYAVPGLVWNAMMSMSGGWFFVVASEAITVGSHSVALPGIGSYVARAIDARDLAAIAWAVVTMLVVILAYDQLLFRPATVWADRFRFEQTPSHAVGRSWVLTLARRGRLAKTLAGRLDDLSRRLVRIGYVRRRAGEAVRGGPFASRRAGDAVWLVAVTASALYGLWMLESFLAPVASVAEIGRVLVLAGATLLRVVVLIALASAVWVPIGVAIGLRPRLAERCQGLAQFLAAFPANLFFPVFVAAIVRWHLDPNVWLSPLMILGTQWYILFNVIAGARAFPSDLREVADLFGVRGRRWWSAVILPGVFPYYVTGAITASGGAWNASIVAERASWGAVTLTASGLGAYIAEATQAGDTPRVVLGIVVMSTLVVAFNRGVWRPLYRLAERRLRVD